MLKNNIIAQIIYILSILLTFTSVYAQPIKNTSPRQGKSYPTYVKFLVGATIYGGDTDNAPHIGGFWFTNNDADEYIHTIGGAVRAEIGKELNKYWDLGVAIEIANYPTIEPNEPEPYKTAFDAGKFTDTRRFHIQPVIRWKPFRTKVFFPYAQLGLELVNGHTYDLDNNLAKKNTLAYGFH